MPYDIIPAMDSNNKFPPVVRQAMALYSELIAAFAPKSLETSKADVSALNSHMTNSSNPHAVTKSQVGLGNVDNTSNANAPVSTAQQTALNLKANLAGPTFTGTVSGITKSMVGLSNVDNTSDTNAPVSTAQQAAIDKTSKGQTATSIVAGTLSGGVGATLLMVDYVQVNLIAGRRYRAIHRCTSVANGVSLALDHNLVKSATSDLTTAGTQVENNATIWTAPAANSGNTHLTTWFWLAATTETVNLKVTMKRIVGSVNVDISERRLAVVDEGDQF